MKQTLLHRLHHELGAVGTPQELQRALTHASFYDDPESEEARTGSRYIFAGQFAFRGAVAEYLFDWIGGTGKQLQQFLGNLFKNKHLETLYEDYGLESVVRCGRSFPLSKHRHIFAYAMLGFVFQYTEADELRRFISQKVVVPNEHLLPAAVRNDLLAQLRLKCWQLWKETPNLRIVKLEDSRYCVVVATDRTILAITHSKSEKYARKKALKVALHTVLDEEFRRDERLQKRIAQRQAEARQKEEAQREEKTEAHRQRKAEQRAERKAREKERRQEAQRRDKLRREAKKRAKARADSRSEKAMSKKEIKALLESEGHLMNSAKRRKLEDKLK